MRQDQVPDPSLSQERQRAARVSRRAFLGTVLAAAGAAELATACQFLPKNKNQPQPPTKPAPRPTRGTEIGSRTEFIGIIDDDRVVSANSRVRAEDLLRVMSWSRTWMQPAAVDAIEKTFRDLVGRPDGQRANLELRQGLVQEVENVYATEGNQEWFKRQQKSAIGATSSLILRLDASAQRGSFDSVLGRRTDNEHQDTTSTGTLFFGVDGGKLALTARPKRINIDPAIFYEEIFVWRPQGGIHDEASPADVRGAISNKADKLQYLVTNLGQVTFNLSKTT